MRNQTAQTVLDYKLELFRKARDFTSSIEGIKTEVRQRESQEILFAGIKTKIFSVLFYVQLFSRIAMRLASFT